jgi:predicted MFS family arabinose efflux permease
VATPSATSRVEPGTWIAVQLAAASVALVAFGLPFSAALFPVAAFVLGFVSQGVKVTVDTLVQRHVDDAFRGRVFSVYDVLFNATFVLGAALAAALVPPSGVSVAVVGAMALAFLALSGAWVVRGLRTGPARPTAPRPTGGRTGESEPEAVV